MGLGVEFDFFSMGLFVKFGLFFLWGPNMFLCHVVPWRIQDVVCRAASWRIQDVVWRAALGPMTLSVSSLWGPSYVSCLFILSPHRARWLEYRPHTSSSNTPKIGLIFWVRSQTRRLGSSGMTYCQLWSEVPMMTSLWSAVICARSFGEEGVL